MADDSNRPALPPIPTDKAADAAVHLKRPFTPAAVKWKIQVTGPKNEKQKTFATMVGYIDARLVSGRLNAVVPGNWEEEPVESLGKNLLRYRLTVLGQTHTDIGEGQGRGDGMLAKATDSDALKRVAVRFGVGEFLYAMPNFGLYITPKEEMKDGKPTLYRRSDGGAGYVKAVHEEWLREEYQRWLDEEGIAAFGEPLDHGDARSGSVGVLLDGSAIGEDEATEEDLGLTPLDDDQAQAAKAAIEANYAELCGVNSNRLAQGRYEKMVADAAHSHAALNEVANTLGNLVESERTLAKLRDELISLVGKTTAKPIIDSAERRGSQEERVSAMEKAVKQTKQDADAG